MCRLVVSVSLWERRCTTRRQYELKWHEMCSCPYLRESFLCPHYIFILFISAKIWQGVYLSYNVVLNFIYITHLFFRADESWYIYWHALPTFICQHLLSFGSEQLDPWKLSKRMGRKRNGGVALIKGGVVSVWVCTRESRLVKTPSLVLKAPPGQLVKHKFLCESRC